MENKSNLELVDDTNLLLESALGIVDLLFVAKDGLEEAQYKGSVFTTLGNQLKDIKEMHNELWERIGNIDVARRRGRNEFALENAYNKHQALTLLISRLENMENNLTQKEIMGMFILATEVGKAMEEHIYSQGKG